MIDPKTILSCFSYEKTLLEALHEIKGYLIDVDELINSDAKVRPTVYSVVGDRWNITDAYSCERIKNNLPVLLHNPTSNRDEMIYLSVDYGVIAKTYTGIYARANKIYLRHIPIIKASDADTYYIDVETIKTGVLIQ